MDELYDDDFEESQVASVAEKRSVTSQQDQLNRNDHSAEASVSKLSKQTSLLEAEANMIAGFSVASGQYEDDFDSALPSAMDVDGPASLLYEDDFVDSPAASSIVQTNSKIIVGEQTPLSNSTHSLGSVGPTNSLFATALVGSIITNANLSAKIALSPTKVPSVHDTRDTYPLQPNREAASPTLLDGDVRAASEQLRDNASPDPVQQDDESALYQSDFQETDNELEAGPADKEDEKKPISAKHMTEEPNITVPSDADSNGLSAQEGSTRHLELDLAGSFVRQASQAAFNAVVAARTPEKSVPSATAAAQSVQPPALLMKSVEEHADEGKETANDITSGDAESSVAANEHRVQEERSRTPVSPLQQNAAVSPAANSPVVTPSKDAAKEPPSASFSAKKAPPAQEHAPVVVAHSPQIAAGFVQAAFAQAVQSASAKYPSPTRPRPTEAAAAAVPAAESSASPVLEARASSAVEAVEPPAQPALAPVSATAVRPSTPAEADVANFIASALTKATAAILSTTSSSAAAAGVTASAAPAEEHVPQEEQIGVIAEDEGAADGEQTSPNAEEDKIEDNTEEAPQEQQEVSDGPMVWDDDLNKLVPYAVFCASHDISSRPGNAESKTASQLRGVVNGNRSGSATKLTKKAQADADRTFLTSLQLYQAPTSSAPKVDESPYRRPVSAAPKTRHVVTKRDLLRARSAGTVRGLGSPARSPSPGTAGQKNKSPTGRHSAPSPKRKPHPAIDHRTVFVPPPLCLPSKTMPKELVNYLFASGRESDLKISLFCQHGRHFATCKAELCIDAHEKYRWLNLIHIKAKEACELVCEADKVWRDKLEVSLAAEIEEKKQELEQQREELNRKLKKRSLAQTKLLRQGVQFYESALPALHRGDVTPEELYASTGWTEEHYENFKRRLIADQQRADIQRKMFLDQQVHKDGEVIEQLKGSLSAPMFYLDGMLKTRLDDIHTAVKRIDACFQSSIKLAAGIGTGKSEEQLKAEAASRSPQKNFVLAERLSRNTKHGFDILKNSLSIIARVCSDVRLMYKGIKRDHDMKQEKRNISANAPSDHSRSPSPARKARPANAVETVSPSKKARPQSAPTGSPSPPRKKKVRSVKSAAPRSSTEAAALNAPSKLSQGSRVSYAADFEDGVDGEESSLLIREDTFEEEIQDMMRDMGMGETGSRRSSSPTVGRRLGSGSVAEEIDEGSVASKGASRAKGIALVEAEPSIALSVGSGIEDASSLVGAEGTSEKAAVINKARSLAASRSGSNVKSGSNNNISTGEVDSEEDESDADAKPGKAKDANKTHSLYDDDFEGDEEMVNTAFGGAGRKSSSGKGKKKKRSASRSKKVAGLMSADVLGVPLARMKASQRNYQTVLHGLLVAHDVPIHIEDTEGDTKRAKLKPITITDVANRPIEISLAPSSAATAKRGAGQDERRLRDATSKSPEPMRQSASSGVLGGATLRCFNCRRKFSEAVVRHLPMPAVSNDETVLQRALKDVNKSKVYLPSFDPLHIPTSAAAQNKWIAQQLELQSELIAHKSQTDVRAGSAALQKHKNPFCSWECVKGWAAVNTKLQMRYNTEILIDVAAGYTVVPTMVDRAAK